MDIQQASWNTFFSACLQYRLTPKKFQTLVNAFQFKNSTPSGRHLIHVLLSEGRKNGLQDPRVPLFASELLHMKLCSAADILVSLLPPTSGDSISDQALPEMEGILRPSIEASILQMMTLQIDEGLLKTNQAIQVILKPLIAWMTRYPSSRALGILIYATLSSPLAHTAISHPSMKGYIVLRPKGTTRMLMLTRNQSFIRSLSFHTHRAALANGSAACHWVGFSAKAVRHPR